MTKNTVLYAVLPRIYKEEEREKLIAMVRHAEDAGISGIAISNIGHLHLLEGCTLPISADWGMNVTNSETLRFLQQAGCDSATVSFELRQEQIRDLQKFLPAEALVYGRLPLMITENCLNRDGHGTCHCGDGPAVLTDRTGAEFPVLPVFGCRNEMQNSKTLFLADKPDYQHLGLTFARLRFTTESSRECVHVLRRYLGEGNWMPKEYTRGLFYRSVE